MQLIKRLSKVENCKITRTINAKASSGLFFNVEFKLILGRTELDSERSKFIISTNKKEILGLSAYEKVELISSLKRKLTYFCYIPNTYYVHSCVLTGLFNFFFLN